MTTIYFNSHQKHAYKVESWRHIFSQWYCAPIPFKGKKVAIYDLSEFITQEIWNDHIENKDYWSREQWMMQLKALVFAFDENKQNNIAIANQIMNTNDPKTIKELGRTVKGYDEERWNACRFKIVVNGNYLQFTQNKEMKDILLLTGNRRLCESTSYDRIWGIGFSEGKAKTTDESKWGLNLLGKAIVEVRDYLTK